MLLISMVVSFVSQYMIAKQEKENVYNEDGKDYIDIEKEKYEVIGIVV